MKMFRIENIYFSLKNLPFNCTNINFIFLILNFVYIFQKNFMKKMGRTKWVSVYLFKGHIVGCHYFTTFSALQEVALGKAGLFTFFLQEFTNMIGMIMLYLFRTKLKKQQNYVLLCNYSCHTMMHLHVKYGNSHKTSICPYVCPSVCKIAIKNNNNGGKVWCMKLKVLARPKSISRIRQIYHLEVYFQNLKENGLQLYF